MSRFHLHLNVSDLEQNIRFYSQLFAAEPSVRKHDYAKWMLDDPRINFAISSSGRSPGIDHLGLQVEASEGLSEIGRRLQKAGSSVLPEEATICCYAQSDKLWTEDPQGIRWESFHTFGESTTYSGNEAACATDGASCTPDLEQIRASTTQSSTIQSSATQQAKDVSSPCCAPASACC